MLPFGRRSARLGAMGSKEDNRRGRDGWMDERTDDGGFTLNFGMYTVHKPGRRHAQEPNGTPVHADDERRDAHDSPEVLGESKWVEECQ